MTATEPRSPTTASTPVDADGLALDVVDVAIVVVTYNSGAHIDAFLNSVDDAAAGRSYRVVVADNGSTDDTADVVGNRPDVVFTPTGGNDGYAAGINHGRRRTGPARAVMIANPDMVLGPGCIPPLLAAAARDGVAVPRLVDEHGATSTSLRREPTVLASLGDALLGGHAPWRPASTTQTVHDRSAYEREHTVDWATGALLVVSEECDRAVGDWDESYFLFSEEVEFATAVRAAGYSMTYVPSASAMHAVGGSRGPEELTGLLAVNELRYFRRHNGRAATLAFAMALLLGLLLRSADPDRRTALGDVARSLPPILLRGDVARLPGR